jgi:hypothetical protein
VTALALSVTVSLALPAGPAQAAAPTAAPVLGPALTPADVYPVPIPTTTTLSEKPHPAVTNQTVTLSADVSSSSSQFPPAGTLTFFHGANPIAGCANEPVATQDQSTTVTCQTSFAASGAPVHLSAQFTPPTGSQLVGSSGSDTLNVYQGSTSVNLVTSSGGVLVGKKVTYTASAQGASGPVSPSGVVEFQDRGKAMSSCASQPLNGGTATCTVRYRTTGRHMITAVYEGDGNFLASPASPPRSVRVLARGTITSTMEWTFAYTPSYTRILALSVFAAPVGAKIVIKCHGTGCPFARRSTPVKRCKQTHAHKCNPQGSSTLGLTPMFHRRRLPVGTGVTVQILRSGWIGKYYLFTMRAGRGPKIKISCLAPGRTTPGQGC